MDRIASKISIPILQYDLHGNFIREWTSARTAAIELKTFPTLITKSCKQNVSCSNYFFKYKTNKILLKIDVSLFRVLGGLREKQIVQYDIDGNFLREWSSATAVQKEAGTMKRSCISAVCRGEKMTAYGFIWKFKNQSN